MDTRPPSRDVVTATGFDETAHAMRAAFGDVRLEPHERESPRLSLQSVSTARLTSIRWTTSGVARARREDDGSVVLVGIARGGIDSLQSALGDIDPARPYLQPVWVDARLTAPEVADLAVARRVVEDHARGMTGDECHVLRFTGTAPREPSLDGLWRDTMTYTSRVLNALCDQDDPALAHTGLLDLVAQAVLRTFPNTAHEAEGLRDLMGARQAAMRRAVQFIDDHLAEPISVLDIAAAARLSMRGLHAAFRRHLDTTPMAYVRDGRLAAVRQELRSGAVQISGLAPLLLRWGFVDERRFAALYRSTYGETPEDTLARSGRRGT